MIITNADVIENSTHRLSKKSGFSYSAGMNFTEFSDDDLLNFGDALKNDALPGGAVDSDDNADDSANSGGIITAAEKGSDIYSRGSLERQLQIIRQQTIQYFLKLFFGEKTISRDGTSLTDSTDSTAQENSGYWVSSQSALSSTYEESEQMTYNAKGTVATADGRSIEFNIEASMSRRFYQETRIRQANTQIDYADPLVINLDTYSAGGISDQRFYFDIDADGNDDELTNLSAGSGFLALDRNGNGQIDDGRELFGAGSGNGFGELSEFDADKNGWIDEADPVFNRLKIFTVDKLGIKRQMSLKEAGVGAINLSAVNSDYTVTDNSNRGLAKIKKSGFFLFENGQSGLLHEVDLAKY